MSFPRYLKYKDSGFQWLGDIPSHWETMRLATVCDFHSGKAHEPFIDDDGEFICVNSRFVSTEGESRKFCTENLSPTQRADILMVMSDLPNGRALAKAFFVDSDEPYAVNQRVCIIRAQEKANARFLYFQLNRNPLFLRHDDGVNQTHLSNATFTKFPTLVPPLPEQAAIASFLDAETAKIDSLIAEQRRLIELLKEKRQAVISHAVTKGLNPHAPLKPSGIEWLGDVPKHWEVGPVKRFFTSLNGRRVPLSGEERAGRSGEFAYYGASGIIDWIDEFIFEEDLVLVSEDGANLISRSTPISFVARGQYWVNNHAHILKPPDANHIFWAERIESIDLIPFVTGSAQPKLTAEAVNNLMIAVPTMESERGDIEKHIVTETTKLDALTAEAERGIELLQERRTALISAAVTGKIDVREFATVSGKALAAGAFAQQHVRTKHDTK